MIKIIENAIPKQAQDEVESLLLSWNFPWFHYANTNYADMATRGDDVPQFTHGFIRDDAANSEHEKIPRAILHHMGIDHTQILRAKANLLMREPAPFTHPAHTDDQKPHIVFIYYVNDSDGDTHFYENGEIVNQVSPKKGRAIMFEGHRLHASSSPLENRFRLVINYNLVPGPYFESL
ncbi:MAG: hypothetical protein ACPGVT_08400 [Maricaulaceae bacterium]